MKNNLYIMFKPEGILNNIYSNNTDDLKWDKINIKGMLELIFLAQEFFNVKCMIISNKNSLKKLKLELRKQSESIVDDAEKSMADKLIGKLVGKVLYDESLTEQQMIERYMRNKDGYLLIFNQDINYPNKVVWKVSNAFGLTVYDAKIITQELKLLLEERK